MTPKDTYGQVVTLQRLLEIENDEELCGIRCPGTGIPLWTQIRANFFRAMLSDIHYSEGLDRRHAETPRVKALATMARSLWSDRVVLSRRRVRAQVLVCATGVGLQVREGKWFNRLSDYFALAFADDTMTLEDHFEWTWPSPRTNTRVVYHAPLQALASIVARLRVSAHQRKVASDLITRVLARATSVVDWSPSARRVEELEARLARRAAALPLLLACYSEMLRKIGPRVVLVEEASYGGPAVALLVAARRLGVRTAEYQHGVISSGHVAYNAHPTWSASSSVRETLPEFLLTYGDWWASQLSLPVRCVAIGNPHRTTRVAAIANQEVPRRTILLLSDGAEFARYLELARAISTAARAAGLSVLLRPHPLERRSIAVREATGVDIDHEPDLYTSLSHAHVVVSEVSTGMLESAGIADRIVVWATGKSQFSFGSHPFESFESGDELARRLSAGAFGRYDESLASQVWANDWQSRYASFLSDVGVKVIGGDS